MTKLVFCQHYFYVFQMPIYLTFLSTGLEFGMGAHNQAVALGITSQTFACPWVWAIILYPSIRYTCHDVRST